jgi:raffinose/stachyose/melibiose transport system substrate-binding protein
MSVTDEPGAKQPEGITRTELMKRGAALAATGLVGGALAGPAEASRRRVAVFLNKKVTVTHWTWAWGTTKPWKDIEAAFTKAHPDYQVKVKLFQQPDYLVALKTAVPNKTAGDVLALTDGSLGRQYNKFLLPLEGPAAKAWGKNWESGFLGGAVNLARTIDPAGKHVFALPVQYSMGGIMWYSRKLFQQAGVAVPRNYVELKAASAQLRKAGIIPAIWGAKDNWPNTDWLVQLAAQYKPGIVEHAEAGRVSFTDPAIVTALGWMKQSLADGIWNDAPFATTAFPEAYGFFLSGKAAMASFGTWATAAITSANASDYAAFLFPRLPDAANKITMGGLPTGDPTNTGRNPAPPWKTLGVAMGVQNHLKGSQLDAATAFATFVAGPSNVKRIGAVLGAPARKGYNNTALTDEWQDIVAWENSLGAYAERREFTYQETRDAIQTAIANVCVNGADPKSELARVDVAAARARKRG